jgi:hypothetical protein
MKTVHFIVTPNWHRRCATRGFSSTALSAFVNVFIECVQCWNRYRLQKWAFGCLGRLLFGARFILSRKRSLQSGNRRVECEAIISADSAALLSTNPQFRTLGLCRNSVSIGSREQEDCVAVDRRQELGNEDQSAGIASGVKRIGYDN